jgi:hypothetical protein
MLGFPTNLSKRSRDAKSSRSVKNDRPNALWPKHKLGMELVILFCSMIIANGWLDICS